MRGAVVKDCGLSRHGGGLAAWRPMFSLVQAVRS